MPDPRRAVFLDRDGVINEVATIDGAPGSPRSVEELVVVDDAARILGELRDDGYLVIVVTNQPEIARKTITETAVREMHAALMAVLPIDAVYCCPHDTGDGCTCRKPHAGMLRTAADERGVDLGQSWLIGDRWVDIAAAREAGVAPVLIEREWSWRRTSSGAPPARLEPDARAADLRAAVDLVLGRRG